MFGFLKTFVRKLVAEPPAQNSELATMEPEPAASESAELPPGQAFFPAPAPQRINLPNRNGQAAQQNKGVQVPLQPIINTLPLELQSKVRFPEVGDRNISVPLDKILAQLSRGTVTITFGELRQAAPDVFAAE